MIVVIDTETTGTDPAKDSLLEVATIKLPSMTPWSSFVRYIEPIPPEAKAVHHIQEKDVVRAPLHKDVIDFIKGNENEDTVYAAHNAQFDKSFLPELTKTWMCTWRCARHAWPDAPSYGNQVLRYFLGLKPKLPANLHPHRALYDTIVTAEIVKELLKLQPVEYWLEIQNKPALMALCTMGEWRGKPWQAIPAGFKQWLVDNTDDIDQVHSAKIALSTHEPRLLEEVGFGKYKGQPWSNMDDGYLSWVLRQDFDADVKMTAREHLNRREGPVAQKALL